MKNSWKRLIAGALALVMTGSMALAAPGSEAVETPAAEAESAQPFSVTVGTYIPDMAGAEKIRAGESYTLIALPSEMALYDGDGNEATLTPAELLAATGKALFIGSAVAEENGRAVFENVRLRTAESVVYYVTGPGLDAPLYEATSPSTSASGRILTDTDGDHSATITLVDAVTGYRYGEAVMAGADGTYAFPNLAPGQYNLRVAKPGYLPTTRTAVTIADGTNTIINLFNLSSDPYTPAGQSPIAGLSRVGDVTGDGVRDMEDLAALMLCYGRAADVPEGFTADLSGDGAVTKADTDLLINAAAKPDPKDITTGTDAAVTDARLTVSDSGAAETASLRHLSFALSSTSTVSAAAFSLSFPLDAVQPLNAKGGLVSPVDGSALASCLVPAGGVEARLTRWSVAGGTATLTFALTCETPKAAGELARFYYRPVSGTTKDFYRGVFTLDHAVALAGRDTVVTDVDLTYPGHDTVPVTAITIDQAPTTLTIPGQDRSAVLALSATGSDGTATYPDLPGVTWSVADAQGQVPAGVSVDRGLLTVTSEAVPGVVYVTAALGDVVSGRLAVTLENAPPVANAILIRKDGADCSQDDMTFAAGAVGNLARYEAVVLDQYGEALAEQPAVSWLLSGAPAGVSLETGTLASDGTTPAGTYTFRVLAQAEGLQTAVDITLTAEARLNALLVSGAQSALIPAEGAQSLTLTYTVTALDAQGNAMPLTGDIEPTFSVAPADQGVDAAREAVSGDYVVTVSPEAQAGRYTLTAQVGSVEGSMELTLIAPAEQESVRAAMYYDGDPLQSARFSLPARTSETYSFTAQLLDAQGATVDVQPETWSWSIDPAVSGLSIPAAGATGVLTVSETLAVGNYAFEIVAADAESGMTVRAPITLSVTPVLDALALTAPARLTIPDRAELVYTLSATALDAAGKPMTPPEDLTWSVTAKGSVDAPAGVSVSQSGVLTLTPAAVPGDITVTVADASGKIADSADITLDPASEAESVLVLYRQITVDRAVVEKNAPVSGQPDAVNAKEGQNVVFTYSAMLVDQATGVASPIAAEQVKWVGAPGGVFQVDENAESGAYSTNVTAVYDGQSASAAAGVTVYPNITGLLLDFGTGSIQPPYELAVPSRGTKHYSATVLAQVERFGAARTVPLSELELTDYELVMNTALTGVYATMDKETGVMDISVDPAAVQNPTSAPTDGTMDIRFIQLALDYFPEETFTSENLTLYLTQETSSLTSAILRRGTGSGTEFSFGTPKPGEATVAAAGTLSNCYALELRDQYGASVVDERVEWQLTVPDELMNGSTHLVSLMDPGEAVENAYPGYASIRRLRVSPDAPVGGPYQLTLVAKAGKMTCSIPILLTVKAAPTPEELIMTMSGPAAVTIPMYYAQYNSAAVNDKSSTATFTAILRTDTGSELDLTGGYSLRWSVTDAAGKAVTGVTVSPASGTASATVQVSRMAQPTGTSESGKLRVTAVLQDAQGAQLAAETSLLELNRSASIPTLMTMRRGGNTVTYDAVNMTSDDTDLVTREYNFHLLDQYNEEASLKARKEVKWTLAGAERSGVTLTTAKDAAGVPYARITVRNPGYSVRKTVKLIASITIPEEKAPSGRQTISTELPITINIGSSTNPGGGGGGDTGDTSSGVPYAIRISGNTTLSTTQGNAAAQTYTFSLLDKGGKACSTFEQAKVTWSASGLKGGITFTGSPRVLSVPASTPAGTYKIILTAKYSTNVSASMTVTVTVSSSGIAIKGDSAVKATQGTALTRTWSATVTDAKGSVVNVPAGSIVWTLSPLKSGSLTVNFDPKTATLTVPANAAVGTLNATLTATYQTMKASKAITVTVSAAGQTSTTGSAPTVMPTIVKSGSTGTVTLTPQQEKAITDSPVTGGTVVIAPTGTEGLSASTVTLTAATARAMAQQKSQSLKVQTAQGTVVLPPQALTALVGQGGNSVSVTISASGGTVSVTFACGYESTSLPGQIAFSAPGSGNVAVRTDADGGKDVVKKAVVKNGKLQTYLDGSAQLTLETRAPSFSDTTSHWAKNAITFTAARELFQGTSATTFSPDATMTRSMVVTVLHRLEDTPAAGATASFADVAKGTWYTGAVDWANAEGIVQGTDKGFKPGDPVTREQLATILYRYVNSLGLPTSQRGGLSGFSDQNKVSSWAKDAMQWAVGAGLINGKSGGLLDPTGNASRAEVSTILQRLITNLLTPSV